MTSHFKTNEVVPSLVENRSDLSSRNYTYNSYSGADISAQILVPNESQPLVLGDLQTLSYSIHRENKPVRLLGQVNPAGFLKGPRCIPASGKVYVQDRGYISIADVQVGDFVQSSASTFNKVLGSFDQGFKLCYKLKLHQGYELTASYDHPIYTDRGWVNMEDIKLTDKVHVTGGTPVSDIDYDIKDEILVMLAYLIGDGTTHKYSKPSSNSKEHRVGLSIADSEMLSIGVMSEQCLGELGIPYKDYRSREDKCITRRISVCLKDKAAVDWRSREYNELHEALLEFGMYDKYSHNKFIPQKLIAELSKRQISLFLSHLFSTDGCYSLDKSTQRLRVNYTSTSEELIDEIRLLLSKMGVACSKRKEDKVGKAGGKKGIVSRHDSYRLNIERKIDIVKFIDRIGIFGKFDRIKDLVPELKYNIRSEGLNIQSRDFLMKAQAALLRNNEIPSEHKACCNIYNYNMPKICSAKAKTMSDHIGDKKFSSMVEDLIDEMISSDVDVISSKIKSLDKLVELKVYDLEVEDRHEFICDFVKVHNTIAGSLIFVNFEAYTFYRLEQFKKLVYSPMTSNNAPLYGLADMLPPFDILITAQNEYGSFSRMRLLGVSIVDEGGTISIEDLVSESQYTFMARGIEPMTSYKPQFKVDSPLIETSPVGFNGEPFNSGSGIRTITN
jgi:intein/homing endonuclease